MPDDRAVSPVIGVILMVAITVVLAGTIGVFILEMGDQLQDGPPKASFSAEYNETALNVTVTYQGGQTIDATDTPVYVMGSDSGRLCSFNGTLRPGDGCTGTYAAGETIRVVWVSADGEYTSTLYETPAPN